VAGGLTPAAARPPAAVQHRHGDGTLHVHHSTPERPSNSAPSSDTSRRDDAVPETSHANAPRDDAHHEPGAQTDCVTQSVAQNSHLTPLQTIEMALPEVSRGARPERFRAWVFSFDPSPFSQRAPPGA
jgi:hypothetical protein